MNFKATTVVGRKSAFAVIAFLYGCGISAAFYGNWFYWLLILPASHLVVDLFLLMGKPVPLKISFVRFLNESAMAFFVGWLILLVYTFTFGVFSSGASVGGNPDPTDKMAGIFFGVGLGLLNVCVPCFIVSAVCSSYLKKANAPPTPFFGDE